MWKSAVYFIGGWTLFIYGVIANQQEFIPVGMLCFVMCTAEA